MAVILHLSHAIPCILTASHYSMVWEEDDSPAFRLGMSSFLLLPFRPSPLLWALLLSCWRRRYFPFLLTFQRCHLICQLMWSFLLQQLTKAALLPNCCSPRDHPLPMETAVKRGRPLKAFKRISLESYMHVCVCMHICVYMCGCECVCICRGVHVWVWIYVWVWVCICMCVCVHACVCRPPRPWRRPEPRFPTGW